VLTNPAVRHAISDCWRRSDPLVKDSSLTLGLDHPGRMRPTAVPVARTAGSCRRCGLTAVVRPDVDHVEVQVLTNRLTPGFGGCWS